MSRTPEQKLQTLVEVVERRLGRRPTSDEVAEYILGNENAKTYLFGKKEKTDEEQAQGSRPRGQ